MIVSFPSCLPEKVTLCTSLMLNDESWFTMQNDQFCIIGEPEFIIITHTHVHLDTNSNDNGDNVCVDGCRVMCVCRWLSCNVCVCVLMVDCNVCICVNVCIC